jgi:ABC-type branched-subunit amino acid transport system ATPase component/branched-subunit amino acid ABC-type transport system permease component
VFNDLLPFIVTGLVTGSVYGVAGTGLVLTYKTSGIFNFAYGAVAAIGIFIFYWLHVTIGIPWPYAAVICLLVLAPAEGLLLEFFARTVGSRAPALKVVATIGLMLVVIGIGAIWYGNSFATLPQFLPTQSVKVGGVYITAAQFIVFGIAIVSVFALYCLLRYVRVGIAMRAIVDDPDLVSLGGVSPVRVRRTSWVIGTVFANLAGLLVAPSLPLEATVLVLLVAQAFGAAAIGFFSNLPLTFIGGLLIGVLGAIITKYTVSVFWLNGLAASLPFIVLFLVLIVTPRRRLAEPPARWTPSQRQWSAPGRVRLVGGLVVVVLFATLPTGLGWPLDAWTTLLTTVLLCLSLGLLIRTSGQVSLCQMTFAAIGAAAFGHFATNWHLPWLLALLCGALVAVPVGAVIAIPAIRLRGVFVAVATLGFAILVEDLFFTRSFMFGPTPNGLQTPAPDFSIGGLSLSGGTGFYLLVLLITVIVVLLVIAIERGRMGRLLAGLRDSPEALEVHGTNINVAKTVVFCISAAIAGLAGALSGAVYQYSVGTQFDWLTSLELVVVVIVAIGATPWYAIIAAAAQVLIPVYLNYNNISDYEIIVFGLSAVVFIMGGGKAPGMPRALANLAERLGGRRAPALDAPGVPVDAATRPHAALSPGDDGAVPEIAHASTRSRALRATGTGAASGLETRDLSVAFGGLRALDGVTVRAPAGRVTGLIGPNGAGKTTLFNACSGLLRPTTGMVRFDDKDVTGVSRAHRAQLGLGRTFQVPELFDSLTVRENVWLGREAGLAGSRPVSQLLARASDKAEVRDAANEALAFVGIEDLADVQAGLLTTGQRRLAEFARLLAGDFSILLLDEPSAGLDSEESDKFGELIREVNRQRGAGILLVEHDIALVSSVCEYVYVLDFGQLIFEGDIADMQQSDLVRKAYLGTELDAPAPEDNVADATDAAELR